MKEKESLYVHSCWISVSGDRPGGAVRREVSDVGKEVTVSVTNVKTKQQATASELRDGEHLRDRVVGCCSLVQCAEVRRRVASSAALYSPIDSTVKVDTLPKREWCATYRVPLNGHSLNR